jgi:FMNH2-dependent dimethyl sulfone monooxygenase
VEDLSARRERLGLPPMKFGMAGYFIVRDTPDAAEAERARITNVQQNAAGFQNYQQWLAGTKLEQKLSLEDYSVSNRGLRAGLVGTPEQIANRIGEYERAGVDLLLLQCSPQFEEMERFAEQVIRPRESRQPASVRQTPGRDSQSDYGEEPSTSALGA